MKSRLRGAVVALAMLPALTAVAAAQTDRLHIGPQIAYDIDAKKFGIGVQLGVPIMRRLEFYPSFMVYLGDPGSFWNINADLKYRVASSQPHWLYVGTGLNISRASGGGGSSTSGSSTNAGLNLFAGAESLKGRIHPFVEPRLIIGDGSRFQIAAGLNFTL